MATILGGGAYVANLRSPLAARADSDRERLRRLAVTTDDRPDPGPAAPGARIDPSILEAERGNLGTERVLPDFRIVKATVAYGPAGELRAEYVTQKKAPSAEIYAVPAGHVFKGESAFLDPHGRVLGKWVKTREGQLKHVIVRVLPGNHDEHAAVAIAHYTSAWYRNEPRVTVDVDPGQFFWHRFGAVMLGSTHGHAAKIADMPMIMAPRRAADWGANRFRYAHGFHLHHKRVLATEGQGCICEVHQSPVPQDGWHYASGFLSGRSMKSITYHREFGERYRSTIGILDAGLAQAA